MKHCIELEAIDKRFGKKQVLNNINLKIPYGSIYGLLGPSGGGKTTIVKIIAGILGATSGRAYVLGKEMPNLVLMNQIGYMAQSDALYTGLSAEENLHFFGSLYGMGRRMLRERAEEAMALVNLSDDSKKPVEMYSGGMKRRLSLAISILHRPPILILDEPTVGIDPLLRKGIWEELNRLAGNGTTILVTTHVMDEADRCHKIAMLRDGRIIADDAPDMLVKNIGASNIEEAFLHYSSGGEVHES